MAVKQYFTERVMVDVIGIIEGTLEDRITEDPTLVYELEQIRQHTRCALQRSKKIRMELRRKEIG